MLHHFYFSSRRRHTRSYGDWSSDVCSSDLKYVYLEKNRAGDHICYYSDLRKMQRHYPQWSVTRPLPEIAAEQIGRASCRERGWSRAGAAAGHEDRIWR